VKKWDIFTKWDIIILIILIVISLVPEGIFLATSYYKTNNIYAEIRVDNKLYKKIPLNKDSYEDTITVSTDLGENVVQVHNKSIGIVQADCPDKICEKPGFISKPGQTLVCLPHKLVITIKGEAKQETDELSY